MRQAANYKQTLNLLAQMIVSLLQKEVEDKDSGESELFTVKNLSNKVLLRQLRRNAGKNARYECCGCRINHLSQKQHDVLMVNACGMTPILPLP